MHALVAQVNTIDFCLSVCLLLVFWIFLFFLMFVGFDKCCFSLCFVLFV